MCEAFAILEAVLANMNRIVEQLQAGGSFVAYARQFSEASTAIQGGDTGFLRIGTLPAPMADAVRQMQPGQLVGPLAIPGGFTIVYLIDKAANSPVEAPISASSWLAPSWCTGPKVMNAVMRIETSPFYRGRRRRRLMALTTQNTQTGATIRHVGTCGRFRFEVGCANLHY